MESFMVTMCVNGINLCLKELQVVITRHVLALSEYVETYVAIHRGHNTLLCLIMLETHYSHHPKKVNHIQLL